MYHDIDLASWIVRFGELTDQIGPQFSRKDLRSRASDYLRGLIETMERKNSWQLAEVMGAATPYGFQRLLGRSHWDADAVRNDLRTYVLNHLGQPDGVLIVDETGFLKKGTKSAGVSRQYSGTAGRVENCQIGVFLAYRTSRGCAFIDRRLYLPKVWTDDPTRCRESGIPEHIAFATKPELARRMIRDAIRAGVPARWVTADAVYGNDSRFRQMLEAEGLDYVVAVSSAQRIWVDFEQVRVKHIFSSLPATEWKRISCGDGTKGKRFYDWAFMPFPFPTKSRQQKGMLCRRTIEKTPKYAYYMCGFRPETSLTELVQAAGTRWSIESGFEQCKQEVGLDHYEVRTWVGWYRHITLALMAHAFLEVLRYESRKPPEKKRGPRLPSLYH